MRASGCANLDELRFAAVDAVFPSVGVFVQCWSFSSPPASECATANGGADMRRAIMALVRCAGLEPNWRVRLARGYSVVVRLKPGFQLGTIEGGRDFHLKMKWDA